MKIRHLITDGHAQPVDEALEPAGVHVLNDHRPRQLLPHPGRAENHVGSDLVKVLHGGLGLFGEVHRKTDG